MPRVLIVEDNEMNRDMLTRRLQRKGFEVDCAVDGQEGVDKALAEGDAAPDLVLLDMDLPVLDGLGRSLSLDTIVCPWWPKFIICPEFCIEDGLITCLPLIIRGCYFYENGDLLRWPN